MRFPRALWELLHTWQGVILAVFAALCTIYYGPRKMLETWDWYLERFYDSKVREFLHSQVTAEFVTAHGPRRWGIPKSIPEISLGTGMSEKRVRACLKRLRKKKQVEQEAHNDT